MSPHKTTKVLNSDGRDLAPTHPARARQLLRLHKAKIVTPDPFTIQLIESKEDSKSNRSKLTMIDVSVGSDLTSEQIKEQLQTVLDSLGNVISTPTVPIVDQQQVSEMPLAQVKVQDVYQRVVIADETIGVDPAKEGGDKTVVTTYYKYEDVLAPPKPPIVEARKPYKYKGFNRNSGDKRDYDNSIKGTWMTEGLAKMDTEPQTTSKKSVYDRHRLVRSQNVEVLYPKDEPNPVYVITTTFQGIQYVAVLTTTLMLGFFEDETYYQNGAWQGGRSEAWYGHHEAIITRTIPGLKKVEDESDEHYGLYYEEPEVTVRETNWGIMWYHSPMDAMAEIMLFNPSRWLEDFHVV